MLTNIYFRAIYTQLQAAQNIVIFNFDSCGDVGMNTYFATNSTHLFAKKKVNFLLYTGKGGSDALNLYYQTLHAQQVVKNAVDCNCIIRIIK